MRITAVHRLTPVGAVVTHTACGTSQEGFDAEWRQVVVFTVDGDAVNLCEMFDEADLDAALARFDEVTAAPPRLENAAIRVAERVRESFAIRDWDAISEIFADDFSLDDRRRTVNAGIRYGPDAEIEDLQAAADVGFTDVTWTVIATRGRCLTLARVQWSSPDQRSEAFHNEWLGIVEIDADDRFIAMVMLDLDDIDAAFQELDARYLAGEAAACAHTWSVITQGYAALNRHEVPPATSDWMTIDHRVRATFEAGDLAAYIGSVWDVAPDVKIYIETVHRLSNLGAVYTQAAYGTSQEGFDAEWRAIALVVDAQPKNRCEVFDETDLDVVLARFDELSQPVQRLENTASQVADRVWMYFPTRDWDAMAEMLADDSSNDDRRPIVGSGFRSGRDAQIDDARAIADMGITTVTSTAIATRGRRLVLRRTRFSGQDRQSEAALLNEILDLVEIDDDERIASVVMFDPDDIDAAFEELETRYLAGEAAAHTHTWSVINGACAAFNRREFPALAEDWVNIDHRRGAAFAPGDLSSYVRTVWDDAPDVRTHFEAVHRLSELGAVVTQVSHGTSQEGFDAERREVNVVTVEGDLISRSEIFDEADLDAALARFDELSKPTP
nr:hypothetical protein [Mycobacterium sp. QGD 101]